MGTLIDTPSFAANEIYQIQATDPVEGAADGASFDGVGISNQPHQQLADRTAFLKQRQDTNIGNIGALQSFTAMFKGVMAANGYVQIPFMDVNRGLTAAFVQWGFCSIDGLLQSQLTNKPFTIPFSVEFPAACEWVIAQWASNSQEGPGAFNQAALGLETLSISRTQVTFFADWNAGGSISIANSASGKRGLTGFYWIAIGF